MITCTRRIEFDYGHRVLGHSQKCKYLHGHRGCAEITCRANQLDELGMVIDFGDIKSIVGKWIDDNFDHNILLNAEDPLLAVLTEFTKFDRGHIKHIKLDQVLGGRAPFIMPHGNPTAENIAKVLFHQAVQLLGDSDLQIVRVRLYETPNSYADCTKE